MAKSDDKAGGKKAGKPRIPKKIGGVKIPKEARRAGEALIDKAQSPAGRQAIASGLAMAATVAAAAVARKAQHAGAPAPPAPPAPPTPPAPPGPPPPPGGGDAWRSQAGIVDPQQIADTIGQVADAVLGKLFRPRPPG